jgi:SPASM domain peptide maturase of grasp-with-spasm system
MSDRYFHLYACNIPVAGASKAIICDLQRRAHVEITLGLYELITEHGGRPVAEIQADYEAEDAERVEEAFQMLVDAELGFWSEDGADRFPPMDLSFESPTEITNAIVDVDASSSHDYAKLFAQLDELGCIHVELRFYDPVSADEIDQALAHTRHSRLRTIQLMLPFAGWDDESFDRVCDTHTRVAYVTVYGADANRVDERKRSWPVHFTTEVIESSDDCGKINPRHFATNLPTFTEAQSFNSCLNRKLGIDVNGDIKNCPSHQQCHGNLARDSLVQITRKPAFREPWTISRDRVEVCRDCEYRYICTDCRVFVTDPDDPLSKPAKCSYDPYSGSWG